MHRMIRFAFVVVAALLLCGQERAASATVCPTFAQCNEEWSIVLNTDQFCTENYGVHQWEVYCVWEEGLDPGWGRIIFNCGDYYPITDYFDCWD